MQFTKAENSIINQVAFQHFVGQHLDIREMLVLQMLLIGATVTEIANQQHCSRRYITRIITAMRKKISTYLGSHFDFC